MKACMIDETHNGYVVPWMAFATMEEVVAHRIDSHPSWPDYVCEYDETDSITVRTRRACLSKRNDPYFHETTKAFRITSPVSTFYNQPCYEALKLAVSANNEDQAGVQPVPGI